MATAPRPSADEIALAPELALLAALDTVLDLTCRTLEAAWPDLETSDDDEDYLVDRILHIAEELHEALADYRHVAVALFHDPRP